MRKLIIFLTLAFTLLIVASCSDDKEWGDPSQYVEVELGMNGKGIYSGNEYTNGNGVFWLYLKDKNTLGLSEVILQLFSDLAPLYYNASLAVGTYTIAKTGERLTIAIGEPRRDYYGREYYVGSTYYHHGDGGGTQEGSMIIAGRIKVEKSGDIYTITTNLRTHRGKSLFYRYQGAIKFT